MEIPAQLIIFVLIVATGMGLGCLFDCYRLLRRCVRMSPLATAIGDFLYWLAASAVVFFVVLLVNQGEISFYIFGFLAVGAAAYFYWLSAAFLWVGRPVIRLADWLRNKIFRRGQ